MPSTRFPTTVYGAVRTVASEDSKSFAISASEGNPPAVTSLARVNVQYVSLAFEGGMVASQ